MSQSQIISRLWFSEWDFVDTHMILELEIWKVLPWVIGSHFEFIQIRTQLDSKLILTNYNCIIKCVINEYMTDVPIERLYCYWISWYCMILSMNAMILYVHSDSIHQLYKNKSKYVFWKDIHCTYACVEGATMMDSLNELWSEKSVITFQIHFT